nr:unnamed protein product [Digitaria exilis]
MEGIATAGPARRNSPSNPINLSMEPGWIQERQQLFAGLSGRVAGRPRASLSMILSAPPGYYTCSDSRPNGGPTWPRRIGDKAEGRCYPLNYGHDGSAGPHQLPYQRLQMIIMDLGLKPTALSRLPHLSAAATTSAAAASQPPIASRG